MAYRKVDTGAPSALERDLLARWEEEDLFHQTIAATADGKPFVFYEGPPTANGRPGIHHVFARTIKDLICRFRSMQGRSVTRIAGWDTHGLPVEIEVEKALEINGKEQIESFGVAEFNRRCRESVFTFKSDWESLSNRIAYWLDYDRPYVTYTNDYIESVWWLLHRMWSKGLLYQGYKVLPYCARCGTALSSHELSQGYASHRSPSIHVLFELLDDGDSPRYLLVWTTTPWTLPSNVAVAVNPDFTYLELEVNGKRVIVERSIAQTKQVPGVTDGQPLAGFPVVAEHRGADLVGLRYRQLIDAVDVGEQDAFRVVAGDFVTASEGTGLVHLAPAFGADDYDTIRREELAFVNPVDESGRFRGTAWKAIEGVLVFDANDTIAASLADADKLFGRYEARGYEHDYPFCWRCDSPLLYYARQSWFVRTTSFKDRMVELNGQVNWKPAEVGSGRFGEWLENNVDWALTRDRYWGTPLPAWVCEDDGSHQTVIGSFAELAERWGRELPDDFDPHKPGIDEVTFACETCGGTMRRVPAVIDAWFDSGAMPYAQWHYPFEHETEHEAHFPADYICEGLDQTRGWFYSLLAISTAIDDQLAYRNVIVNGLLLDADGRKMSKRLGNVSDPWEVVEEFGADAVRLYLLGSGQVWLPKRFDTRSIPEVSTGFLTRLKNTYNFFAQYAAEWTPRLGATPVAERPLVDRWLLSRLDEVVATVGSAWEGYDVRTGVRAIIDFCDDDLSNWYVRLNRHRFWAPDSTADPAALATLHETLQVVARLLAPAGPFLSDALHRELSGTSVHLAGFPKEAGIADAELNRAMEATRRLASLARSAREEAGLKVRQPLATLRVAVPAAVPGPAFDACLDLLQREVNVKHTEVVGSDAELVRLRAKPNFRTLGKVYGKATPEAARAAGDLSEEQLRGLEAGREATVSLGDGQYVYRPEDVVVEREVSSDWVVQADGPYVVALDPEVTDDLRGEGLAREVVNRVQRLRKKAGYEFTTRIELGVAGPAPFLSAVADHAEFIAGETLARSVSWERPLEHADLKEAVDIDGQNIVISMTRNADPA